MRTDSAATRPATRRGRRTLIKLVVILALVAASLPLTVHEARAAQFLLFTADTYGPNQVVQVSLGDGDYHTDCPAGGVNDFVDTTTDFYIVPSGTRFSEGQALQDVQGQPHTVVYSSTAGFVDEPFGFTAPFGKIGPGTYEVVWDECQTGKWYGAFDTIQDPAFTVSIPSGTIPPVDPAVAKIKTDAGNQATQWANAAHLLDAYYALQSAYDAYSCASDPVDCLIGADAVLGYLQKALSQATGVDIETGIKSLLANLTKQYASIAADPPDPHFTSVAPAILQPALPNPTDDPMQQATVAAGAQANEDGALAEALLHAIERYQGAANADNGTWALIQAKAIRDMATSLSSQLTTTNSALQQMRSALVSDPRDIDHVAANEQSTIAQVASSGFNVAELARLHAVGLSDAQIATLQTQFTSQDFSGYSKASLESALDSVMAANRSAATTYAGLANDMGPMVANLQSQLDGANASGQNIPGAPQANAGGPYTVAEGTPITLNGAGSTTPQGSITTYGWDLTGNGAFTDASGPSPTVTFNRPFNGLIGLRVTNDAGLQSIAYTHLMTTGVNQPPTITTFAPTPLHQQVTPGGSIHFSVSASDPEGDPISVAWSVDGVNQVSGMSFLYSAPMTPGTHIVQAMVTDSHPADGSDSRTWLVDVATPSDTTAPTTSATLSPSPNAAGWNTGPVQVTLSATDPDDAVAATYYAIDGPTCSPSSLTACSTYTAPFTVSGDGTHTVSLFSKDSNGNLEQPQRQAVRIDGTAPTCGPVSVVTINGVKTVQVPIQDPTSGLATVGVNLVNAMASIPPYASGITPPGSTVNTQSTTSALTVSSVKQIAGQSASINLKLSDTAGNTVSCDPVMTAAIRQAGKPESMSVSGVGKADHLVHVVNDTPGVGELTVTVNGQDFKLHGMKDGQSASLEIGSALKDGTNSVTVTTTGKPGGSATLLFGNI